MAKDKSTNLLDAEQDSGFFYQDQPDSILRRRSGTNQQEHASERQEQLAIQQVSAGGENQSAAPEDSSSSNSSLPISASAAHEDETPHILIYPIPIALDPWEVISVVGETAAGEVDKSHID